MKGFKKLVLTGVLALGPIIGAGAVSAAPSHTVSSNDTLWAISQKYGISLKSLITVNPQLVNPNLIWPGIVLNIPGKSTGIGSGYGTGSGYGSGNGSQQGTGTDSTTQSSYASQVVNLVNQERAKAGLSPLASDSALTKVALDKAKDMYEKGYFDHNSPTYGSPFDMMRSYGIRYTYAGENIAKGQRTPQEVMDSWMNSPGHRQNIMSPNFNKIGVAYYNGVWVQMFIKN